jgi:hypothetical protein
MGIIEKVIGPLSKYDKSIPYTYMAKVQAIQGDGSILNHYFADTICGLIEYLDEDNILPAEVELCGIYQGKEINIQKDVCTSDDGNWIKRPKLCDALEKEYEKTLKEEYKGHINLRDCSFEDRERKGDGPY